MYSNILQRWRAASRGRLGPASAANPAWFARPRALAESRPTAPVGRSGATMLELLVAFTLLTTVLTTTLPMVVRHGRLLAEARHYRVALDELSNQLERLASLPADELPGELERLKPSALTAARLPGAELHGELTPVDFGRRLALEIAWDEPQRRATPVRLAALLLRPGPSRIADEEGAP